MANIEARKTKNGYSFHITVDRGRDADGNRIRDRIVYKSEPGMTKRQADKAAQRYAVEYEQRMENGYILNDSRTFAEYAQYVLDLKLDNKLRIRTYERYQELLRRILPHIGHLKLTEIRPQHLNLLYSALRQPKLRDKDGSATANIDIAALLKDRHISRAEVARRSGVSPVTVGTAVMGKTISASNAWPVFGEIAGSGASLRVGPYTNNNNTVAIDGSLTKVDSKNNLVSVDAGGTYTITLTKIGKEVTVAVDGEATGYGVLADSVSGNITELMLGGSQQNYYKINEVVHSASWAVLTPTTPAVPEPATATLSLLALAGLASRRRRK